MKKNVLLVILLVVIIGVGSFYGGMIYGKSKNTGPAGLRGQFNGNFADNANRQGLGQNGETVTSGQIIKMDDNSITVELRDGGSKIILFSDSTTIGKFIAGTKVDLAADLNVMVNGKANTDGSISATSIQIRPAGSTEPTPPAPNATPAATTK